MESPPLFINILKCGMSKCIPTNHNKIAIFQYIVNNHSNTLIITVSNNQRPDKMHKHNPINLTQAVQNKNRDNE